MLYADKNALRTNLKVNMLRIRERELTYYTNNCLSISTSAVRGAQRARRHAALPPSPCARSRAGAAGRLRVVRTDRGPVRRGRECDDAGARSRVVPRPAADAPDRPRARDRDCRPSTSW